MFKVSGHG